LAAGEIEEARRLVNNLVTWSHPESQIGESADEIVKELEAALPDVP